MKKHIRKILIVLTVALLVVSVLASCDTTNETVYTVSFIADGKVVKTVATKGNEVIAVPDAPEIENYEFIGWYLDRWQWKQPFDGNNFAVKTLTSDVEVYAYYKEIPAPQKYNIYFNVDGELIDVIQSAGNEILTLPTAPKKDNFEFKGWFFDDGVWNRPFTADYFAETALTENVHLYAYYKYITPVEPEPAEYDIIFYAFGEEAGRVKSAGNEVITLPGAPEKDNYDFVGWYLDENVWSQPFDENYFEDKAVTQEVKVYAYYRYVEPVEPEPAEYDIIFYAFGEETGRVQSAGNEAITLPVAPVKEHYEFRGWYLDEGVWTQPFDENYFADEQITNNVSVYALYERVKYDIVFFADGIEVGTIKSAGNEVIFLPTEPAKENYEFVGWYLDENVWSQPFTAEYFADKATVENVNVYARYIYVAPTYTVTFDTDGGTDIAPVKVSVIDSEPVTTREGYDFDGWYLDNGFTQRVSFPFTVEKNCTLYARWVEKTVSFMLDENNMISGINGVPVGGYLYIPSTVNGVKVQGIASNAFADNNDIVTVEVDPSITKFGSSCFSRCYNLQSVKISDNTTYLPDFMFQWSSKLSQFDIPSALTSVGWSVFQETGLTSVVFPASIKSIGKFAFKDCKQLESIDLGNVATIGEGVFQNCTSLTSIAFPDTIESIDANYMFMGCSKLSEVVFPDVAIELNYNFVHDTAYYNDSANWEDGALYVGNHLITVDGEFKNKTSFSVRPGTLTVARLAFYESHYDPKLASLTLPDGLKIIGERAFEGCNLLARANIPDSVVRIGEDAFNNTALVRSGQTNYVGNWLINYYLPSGETVVEVREGTVGIVDGQLTDSQSSVTEVRLPSTLRYIGASNFGNMSNLTAINAPATLETIGEYAFNSCRSLVALDLTACAGLKSIGETAFTWCSALRSLYIPRSVEYIGRSAFNQTSSITLYIEREQDEIPSGWDNDWNFTYAANPLNIVWGASPADVQS